jgi:orotidine-5'-phosphate decarboxylase
MDEKMLRRELKVTRSLRREVAHLARLAQRAGMSGVVASPQEIKMLRRGVQGKFVILTPGVRPVWAGKDDQKRVMTPAEASWRRLHHRRPVLKAGPARSRKDLEESSGFRDEQMHDLTLGRMARWNHHHATRSKIRDDDT